MFDIAKIIATTVEVGSQLPAYKALFDHVVATFSERDQEVLKNAYVDARTRSDDAHRDAQAL